MLRSSFAVLLICGAIAGWGCADAPIPLGGATGAPPWLTLWDQDARADVAVSPADLVPGEDLPPTPDVQPIDLPPAHDEMSPPETAIPPDTTDCPIAKITCEEGNEVIPQTMLHLDAAGSWSSFGAIETYQWSVTQPPGSVSLLKPGPTYHAPVFEANVAGLYAFELMVWDETGTAACEPAVFEVAVIPDDGIHVELLWHTPGDPDETDEGWGHGSDIDLHLMHPVSEGWFDPVYDCHHYNKTPDWGTTGPQVDDDPRLDRDDIDGAGPENINIHSPQAVSYRVGVHSWSEHGFGNSTAEVRVYLGSVLAFLWGDVEIGGNLMWNVCKIRYHDGEVEAIEGQFGGPQMSWIDPPPPP